MTRSWENVAPQREIVTRSSADSLVETMLGSGTTRGGLSITSNVDEFDPIVLAIVATKTHAYAQYWHGLVTGTLSD